MEKLGCSNSGGVNVVVRGKRIGEGAFEDFSVAYTLSAQELKENGYCDGNVHSIREAIVSVLRRVMSGVEGHLTNTMVEDDSGIRFDPDMYRGGTKEEPAIGRDGLLGYSNYTPKTPSISDPAGRGDFDYRLSVERQAA